MTGEDIGSYIGSRALGALKYIFAPHLFQAEQERQTQAEHAAQVQELMKQLMGGQAQAEPGPSGAPGGGGTPGGGPQFMAPPQATPIESMMGVTPASAPIQTEPGPWRQPEGAPGQVGGGSPYVTPAIADKNAQYADVIQRMLNPPGKAATEVSAPAPTPRRRESALPIGTSVNLTPMPGVSVSMTGGKEADRTPEWMNSYGDRLGVLLADGVPYDQANRQAQLDATKALNFAPTGAAARVTREPKATTASERTPTAYTDFRKDFVEQNGSATGVAQAWQDFQAQGAGANAGARAGVPTAATRTMSEAAPKVLALVNKVEKILGRIETGPAKSRLQEFMAGKVGAPNPDFITYRTNVGLLTTLLMRMHVGARGGEQLREHFQSMLNSSAQSAPNMRAALEAVKSYANDVAGGKAPTVPTPEPTEPPPAASANAAPAPTRTTAPPIQLPPGWRMEP